MGPVLPLPLYIYTPSISSDSQVLALILSDVIGDPLEAVASGPTVPCPAPEREALRVLSRHRDLNVPDSVVRYLEKASEENANNFHPPIVVSSAGDTTYAHVENVVIGNNRIAATAAQKAAGELGYKSLVWSLRVSGEARLLGQAYAEISHMITNGRKTSSTASSRFNGSWHPHLLKEEPFSSLLRQAPELSEDLTSLLEAGRRLEPPACLIGAGEPTVTVRGSGVGGRNQELALAFAIHAHRLAESKPPPVAGVDAVFAAIGTDGQDGQCSAAGAVVDRSIVQLARGQGLNADGALENNDSHTFFSELCGGKCLIQTGLTGTNVMDLHLLLLTPTH